MDITIKKKFVPKKAFKKGNTPWNKGTKGICKQNSNCQIQINKFLKGGLNNGYNN